MTRDEQCLEAMAWMGMPITPTSLARCLHLCGDTKLDAAEWCPVTPPRIGETCATVPRQSRDRVKNVLDRLVESNQVKVGQVGRNRFWSLTRKGEADVYVDE